mmetsp:Transcript_31441/g.50500  ORF Transcript_31441/g.50500 Transcript_31441/m.50500 type:complete len:168 (-) Transcript_31441:929-1432(-)
MSATGDKAAQFLIKIKGLSKENLLTLCTQQNAKIKQMSQFKKLAAAYLKKNKALQAEIEKKSKTPEPQTSSNKSEGKDLTQELQNLKDSAAKKLEKQKEAFQTQVSSLRTDVKLLETKLEKEKKNSSNLNTILEDLQKNSRKLLKNWTQRKEVVEWTKRTLHKRRDS